MKYATGFMILLLAIPIMVSLPELLLRTYPTIGFARYAVSEKISLSKSPDNIDVSGRDARSSILIYKGA